MPRRRVTAIPLSLVQDSLAVPSLARCPQGLLSPSSRLHHCRGIRPAPLLTCSVLLRCYRGGDARAVLAGPALAIVLGVAHPTVGTLGAAVTAAEVADIGRGAALPIGAREALAVVVGRASLPVAAVVGAVALARGAATAAAGAGAVLAVDVGAADGRVRAFGAAGAAALVGGVARGATGGIDAGEVLAIGAARTALTVAAAVRAVPVTRGATAAVAGARSRSGSPCCRRKCWRPDT